MTSTPATVIPSIRYRDAHAGIAFLAAAFGFEPRLVVPGPDDTVAHSELLWDGGAVMVGSTTDGSDGRLDVAEGPSWVYVVVDDIAGHYQRAVAAGAEVVKELEDTEFGSQGYTVRDPEGNVWSFGTYRVGDGD